MIINNDLPAYKDLIKEKNLSLWIFSIANIYRFIASTVILIIFSQHDGQIFFGNTNPAAFEKVIIYYVLTSTVILLWFSLIKSDITSLIVSSWILFIIDLCFLSFMTYLSYSSNNITGSLMLIPIAFSGVLIIGRLSTFVPAFAFLSLAFIDLLSWKNGSTNASVLANSFYQSGLLGIQFFIINTLFQIYSKMLIHTEEKVSILEKLQAAEEKVSSTCHELKTTSKKLEVLLESAGEGVLGINKHGQVTFANPCAGLTLECKPKHLINTNICDLLTKSWHKESSTNSISNVQKVNFNKLLHHLGMDTITEKYNPNIWRTKKGNRFFVEFTCEELTEGEGYVIVFQDISSRKENEDMLNHLANYDYLTDVPNRQNFISTLNRTIDLAKRTKEKVAILYLDLDHFKFINDTLGHSCGDHLLTEISNRLSQSIRSSDMVARIGGDEFAIMLTNYKSERNISSIAQKILDRLYQPINLDGSEFNITSSIGISIFPTDAKSTDELIQAADSAMYCAKQNGRGKYHFYEQKFQEESLARNQIQISLQQALPNKEFYLNFQPVVDLSSNEIASMEVLIRWKTGDGKQVSPDQFIPLAEDSGKIRDIGIWVLETSLQQIGHWQEQLHYSPTLAINVSSKQLNDSTFRLTLEDLLEKHQISPNNIEIELTETGVMENPEHCLFELKSIHELGVKVSIDDFGTGYSSLDYLRSLPLDRLKIDQSFTKGIGTSSNDEELIKLILSIAKCLKLQVIAEGVETEEQLAFLKENGCELAQGYLFSKPATAQVIAGLFQQKFHVPPPTNQKKPSTHLRYN